MEVSAAQVLQAGAALLAYAALCWYYLVRPRGGALPQRGAVLVGYASQGGEAERIARWQAGILASQGPVAVQPLNQIDDRRLQGASLALFVVSTYGEGEPPDNALRFARRWTRGANGRDLSHLHFAVLALGDSNYRHFCGFGLALERGLREHGGRAMFDAVMVDRLQDTQLAAWRQQLLACGVGEGAVAPVPAPPAGGAWDGRLVERRVLNAGSPGAPVFHLRLACPASGPVDWQAGDIAVLSIPDPVGRGAVVTREYSIASLPGDGTLDLVVRQVRKDDGALGIGSGWLTAGLALGQAVTVNVRGNPAFHAPPAERPMILIGNGSGIAGLRAHLRHRECLGARRNWLVFGERTRRHDRLFDAELGAWRDGGHLERLDRVFSRDGGAQRYVQDLLRDRLEPLRAWLDAGAAIYVCGSARGMAPAIHRLLLDLLGEAGLEALTLEGRYRRDVY
ncbi:sulfite reductase subunit alpha [Parahaliea mediterranea]|uniref:NADPH--hemoprotein reductase n=1 Tax=Parahaliea mediterranea TaxID=651086 RepID=A0A939IL69_9GAMM|nr:sulfite reductase subunit alpha [Parahaliea mediterranea]MBN7798076.1 flavodoxin domain-containing protein [Parahaliea mediterranea]